MGSAENHCIGAITVSEQVSSTWSSWILEALLSGSMHDITIVSGFHSHIMSLFIIILSFGGAFAVARLLANGPRTGWVS
jgi:hypothetical protein